MTTASPPDYRKARTTALLALADMQLQADAAAPDAVRFFNEKHGFVIRLSAGDVHCQRIIPWRHMERARVAVVREVVKEIVEALARADMA